MDIINNYREIFVNFWFNFFSSGGNVESLEPLLPEDGEKKNQEQQAFDENSNILKNHLLYFVIYKQQLESLRLLSDRRFNFNESGGSISLLPYLLNLFSIDDESKIQSLTAIYQTMVQMNNNPRNSDHLRVQLVASLSQIMGNCDNLRQYKKTDLHPLTFSLVDLPTFNEQLFGLLLKIGSNPNDMFFTRCPFLTIIAAKDSIEDPIALKVIELISNLNAENEMQYSALHCYARAGNIRVVDKLLNCNVKIDAFNDYGDTPFVLAAKQNHVNIMEALLKRGAISNTRDNHGDYPIHKVIHRNKYEAFKLLVALTNDVNITNNSGTTPLIKACRRGEIEFVKLLLTRNPNIDLFNDNRSTPLMEACKKGHYNIVQLLLTRNPDLSIINQDERIAYDEAIANGHGDIANLLLAHINNQNIINN